MSHLVDFNTMAAALVLYYEQRDSLFAEQVIADKLGEKVEVIRAVIQARTHQSPEKVVRALEPARIKRVISETARAINDKAGIRPDIQIEPMIPEETENGGKNLGIRYHFAVTLFGVVLIASTAKGVCYLAFSDAGNNDALDKLRIRFPNADYEEGRDDFQQVALSAFDNMTRSGRRIHLHLKGTPFQIRTWNKLLLIPRGGLVSYSGLTDDPKNSHALGAAVGSNPIAYLVPCHRTVRATGEFGDYHWGSNRKAALICLESAGGTQ